jgi:ABC-2 type transport system ATP-binding protein
VVVNGSLVASAATRATRMGAAGLDVDAEQARIRHLRSRAALAGLPRSRVDQVLSIVGLSQAAGGRVGKYSTGMR